MANVIENITKTCEGLGDVELSGIKLETAERDILNVSWGDLDQHVAMQPAAMAYFGSLKKESKRRMGRLKDSYDRWEKKKYAEAKVLVVSETTAISSIKVEDVKARFIVENESEIEERKDELENAQAEYDTLDNWLEAWKQKGFSLHEYVSIDSDERMSGSGSVTQSQVRSRGGGARKETVREEKEVSENRFKTVRDIMKKRRADGTQ